MVGRVEVSPRERRGDRIGPIGDTDGRGHPAQRVLGHHPVLRLAEEQTDRRLVVRMRQQIVHRRHVHAQLSEERRLELDRLQLEDDIATEPQVVEEQIAEELVATELQPHLAADEGEALAHLQQEPADVIDQRQLEIPFAVRLLISEEIEQIRVTGRLLR